MAGFNEREFEFCFNAEFVKMNSTSLIGTPIIPSQRKEYLLGYDVEFRLKNGEYSQSIFLQHKITSYAENRSGNNLKFWDCYKGPYYRFKVAKLDKTNQHNLLVDLAKKEEDVYYCAPIFTGQDNLQNHFVKNAIIDNSRFFDPISMGKIKDFDQHHVTCDTTGSYGWFHSEPTKIGSVHTWGLLLKSIKHKTIDMQYVEHLGGVLSRCINNVFMVPPSIPDNVKEKGVVSEVSYLLRRYFALEWLILP